MRNLFRRFSVFACTLFWNNGAKIGNPIRFIRKYWAQLVLSSIVIQTIACAYGGEDVYYGDSSKECRPEFDATKFNTAKISNDGYTNCEKEIIEQVVKAQYLQNNFNKRSDATIETWAEAQQKVEELAETCEMEHLKAEGSLTEYVCGDGKSISVEEYESQKQR